MVDDHVLHSLDLCSVGISILDLGAPLVMEVDDADADQGVIHRIVTLLVLLDRLPEQ